jgi:hypothetical protein
MSVHRVKEVVIVDSTSLYRCDCCQRMQLVLHDKTGAAFAEVTITDELIEWLAGRPRQHQNAFTSLHRSSRDRRPRAAASRAAAWMRVSIQPHCRALVYCRT